MVRRSSVSVRFAVTPAAHLKAVLDLLHEIAGAGRPADAVVADWFRARRAIGDADRGDILELIQALLRHHARLGWWLARQGRADLPRTRLLIWLAFG
eukprot:gene59505-79401_t